MRRIALATASVAMFLTPALAFAAGVPIQIIPPNEGVNPYTSVGTVLSNGLTIIFIVAALAVLFMLIWGAFQWITSGGDKEKVGAARGRITNALIGLAVLALAFLITVVVGRIVSIDLLNLKVIPSLDSPVSESTEDKALRENNAKCAKETPPKVWDPASRSCQ